MTGIEFYEFLYDTFRKKGESICDGFTFQEWVIAEDGTSSLRYSEMNGTFKSLPKDIIVAAWETSLNEDEVQYQGTNPAEYNKDSRITLLNELVKVCAPLRVQSLKSA